MRVVTSRGFVFAGALLVVAMATAPSCKKDESDEPIVDETVAVDFDSTTTAVAVAAVVADEAAGALTEGPVTAEEQALFGWGNADCAKVDFGTCPSVTATCDLANIVVSVVLAYDPADACDATGTVTFTRNALRDWTVDFAAFQRGDLALDGAMGFTKSGAGAPWELTLTALQVTGALVREATDTTCTSCTSYVKFDGTVDLTLDTTAPISVDLDMVTTQTLVTNGGLAVAGSVSGQAWLRYKTKLGNEQTVLDGTDVDVTFANEPITFAEVTYPVPPGCTCPSAGSISGASTDSDLVPGVDCGTMTVSFTEASGTPCATVDIGYVPGSDACAKTAEGAAKLAAESCQPVTIYSN